MTSSIPGAGVPALTSFAQVPSSSASGPDPAGECLCCTTSGRPLPEGLRPSAPAATWPATTEACLGRILGGPGAV